MNAVGIDVSKGKSTVVVMRPFGEVVAEPFEVSHTDAELSELACFLGELPGETRIVMEYTGNYWQPIAKVLYDAGLFVCVVNALLIYKYGNNSIRKGKTDKLVSTIQHEMLTLASQLPEYPIVMRMFGVGPVLGPQLMAEIGDVRRFDRKQSLVAFAGVDAPPCQSGAFDSKKRHISKRGSPRLRKTLFQVMSTLIQHAPADDPVFQFLDRKRQEGKHYYVYMTAAANKFLRIYYGTVTAYLEKL